MSKKKIIIGGTVASLSMLRFGAWFRDKALDAHISGDYESEEMLLPIANCLIGAGVIIAGAVVGATYYFMPDENNQGAHHEVMGDAGHDN